MRMKRVGQAQHESSSDCGPATCRTIWITPPRYMKRLANAGDPEQPILPNAMSGHDTPEHETTNAFTDTDVRARNHNARGSAMPKCDRAYSDHQMICYHESRLSRDISIPRNGNRSFDP